MENQDQNMEQVEARSTNKFASLGTALAVVFLALIVSSFTLYNKAKINLAQTCYEYTGNDQPTSNSDEAMNPASYASETNNLTCPPSRETLCGICFQAGDFELDGSGQPLFRDPITDLPTPLGEVVLANWNNPGVHNSSITASNNKTVTLQFRAKK